MKIQELGPIPDAPEDPILLALGFTLAHDAVDTAIVGTTNPDHVRQNVEIVERLLPIAPKAVETLQRRYDMLANAWRQQG
jgi:aryl-alcohol dehydrogenase-like predicted oxidoreductase